MSLDRPVTPNPYDFFPRRLLLRHRARTSSDGQPLKDDQVFALGNTVPAVVLVRCPGGYGVVRRHLLRSGRADAERILALGAGGHSGRGHVLATGAATHELPLGAFHCRNDGGGKGFMGADPPQGDQVHRYYFVVHAVSQESLGVDSDASPAVVSFNLAFKTLGRAIIHGTYQF